MLSTSISGPIEAPAIVFLHGFLGCKEDFDPIISQLNDRFHCVSVDLPGHGASEFYEETLEALVLTLKGLGRFHLVGYSLGGRIARYVAHLHPLKIESLILLSSHPGLSDPHQRNSRYEIDVSWAKQLNALPFSEFLNNWYQQPVFQSLQNKPELLEQIIAKKLKQQPSAPAQLLLQWSLGKVPPVNCSARTLYLCGEEDLKFAEFYRTLPGSKVFPGCGHILPAEAPVECAREIVKFIGGKMAQLNWQAGSDYSDILYHKAEGIAKITINRPEVRNAFRPQTVDQMIHALNDAKEDRSIGVIILTGQGNQAFCSGGDQRIRGDAGYADAEGIHRLNVLDFQKQIRSCPKPIVAMVAGYAIGGGHVLHVMCDLTIAADNAIFGQVGPKVGSFDGGYGASFLARSVGQKKAREIWFLCRQYNAQQALEMGLVNCVVPLDDLETTTIQWCKEMLQHSPLALRCLKSALNADCDGQAGLQELAGNATMLYYMTEEAQEGHRAFLEKRTPDFSRFPKRP